MVWESGKNSDAKKIMIKLPPERGEKELYLLDRAQVNALLTLSHTIEWMTRHVSLPSYADNQDKLSAFMSETQLDLMRMVDFCSQLEGCLDTLNEIIANAIASNSSVQDAIRQFVMNDPDIYNSFGTQVVSGKGGPQIPTEVISNPEEYGELWSQCVQITEYTNDAIVQLLAVLETQSNNIELIEHSIDSIPMFQFVLDAVPADSWLEFADYFLEIIGEQYDSGYDATIPSGSKWLICCEVFCLCKPDKTVTIERLWDAISNLLIGFATPSWENAQELVESLVGVNDNSTIVAYSCFGLMWGVAKLSSFLGVSTVTNKALSVILEIAKNDANDDWEELCIGCPPDPIEGCQNFISSEGMWSVSDEIGTYTGGGYEALYFSAFNDSVLWIEKEPDATEADVIAISFAFDIEVDIGNASLYVNGTYSGGIATPVTTDSIIFSAAETGGTWPKGSTALFQLRISSLGTNDWKCIEACLVYA